VVTDTVSVVAGEALPNPFVRVRFNASRQVVAAGLGEAHDGIIVSAAVSGQAVEMIPASSPGVHKIRLGGTCAVGSLLYGAAAGAAATAAAGVPLGTAEVAGVDTAHVAFRPLPPARTGPMSVTSVKTATYTAAFGEVVLCNPTASGFTVNLPAAVPGQPMIIVKNDSTSTNTITIDAAGAETIDGAATATIAASRGVTRLVPGAGTWYVV
jgi:hypothetical protein